MIQVFLRAGGFFLVILAGIFCRSIGFLGEKEAEAFRKALMYVTLPASIVANFAVSSDMGLTMLMLLLWGMGTDVIVFAFGVIYTRFFPSKQDEVYQLCMPCYNIGTFGMPFVTSFLPGMGVVTACCFDAGNAIPCCGGTYAYLQGRKEGGFDLNHCIRQLVTSPPLIAYGFMFLLTILRLSIPAPVISLLTPAASANTFTAMFMIGLYFRLELKKEYMAACAKVIIVRLIFGAAFTALTWYFFPVPLIAKQTLTLLYFAPVSSMAPAYVALMKGDAGLASCANSLSILVSLMLMPVLAGIMGV